MESKKFLGQFYTINKKANSPYEQTFIFAASYIHESPNQVIGVGVILFGGELRGVELSGSQDLQHALQSIGYRYRTALLGCIDDVYHLGKKGKQKTSQFDA